MIAPAIAKAAYHVLGRANYKQIGNGDFKCEEDILSGDSIDKIYKTWIVNDNTSYFLSSNYPKAALQYSAPKQEHLDEVISFFMKYMDQEPEKCIFKTPPKCPLIATPEGYIWWRMYDGELDGDLPLSPKAIKRLSSFPKIKKK